MVGNKSDLKQYRSLKRKVFIIKFNMESNTLKITEWVYYKPALSTDPI